MQSKKVELKPKVIPMTPNQKPSVTKETPDEVIITLNDRPAIMKVTTLQNPNTINVQTKQSKTLISEKPLINNQPTRVLMPEKNTESENPSLEDEESEYEIDYGEEVDGMDDLDDEYDVDEDESETSSNTTTQSQVTQSHQTSKRKPRTKKVYPPSDEMFDQLIKCMCELRETTRKVITLTRETQKCVNRENRELKNQVKKQKGDKPKRTPRGFAIPSLISNEMMDYLLNIAKITHVDRKVNNQVIGQVKIESGCQLARNELTSALCEHFRNSGMRKNEQDHRKIYLDSDTTKLFGIDVIQFTETGGLISENNEPIITYFDLQKYLPRHCGKNAVGH